MSYEFELDRDGMFNYAKRVIGGGMTDGELFKHARESQERCIENDIEVDVSELLNIMKEVRDQRKFNLSFKCFNCFNFDARLLLDSSHELYCEKGYLEPIRCNQSFDRVTKEMVDISLACNDYDYYDNDAEILRENREIEKDEYIFYVENVPNLFYGGIFVFITKKQSWLSDKNICDDPLPKKTYRQIIKKGIYSSFDGVFEISNEYFTEGYNYITGRGPQSKKVKEPLIDKSIIIDFLKSIGFEYNEEFGKYAVEKHIENIGAEEDEE